MAVDQAAPGDPPPTWPTRFVGRGRELSELCRLLSGPARLLTLCALGGAGKSRLAAEVARRYDQAGTVEATVWVSLAPVADASAVLPLVTTGLGLPPATVDPVAALPRLLAGRHLLVVLDNCEHLVPAAAEVAELLLGASPGLKVLATSRVPLGAAGEQVYPVPALSTTAEGRFEAVELFLDRVRLAAPSYQPTGSDRRHLEAVCVQLHGLPLAIELAAPWMRVLSALDLHEQVSQVLEVPHTSLDQSIADRHRSLGGVLQTCWDGLEPGDRQVFAALGVFVGGCTLAAAQAVAGASLSVLASLSDQALVQHGPDVTGATRFQLHELLRTYAGRQLAASPEVEQEVRERHLDHFLSLADQAAGAHETADEPRWLAALDRDRGNLDAALAWALSSGRPARALRLTAALRTYWSSRCATQDYLELVLAALAMPWDGRNPQVARDRAQLLNLAGWAASNLVPGGRVTAPAEAQPAQDLFAAATSLAHDFADLELEASGLRGLAYVQNLCGRPGEAVSLTEQSHELSLRLDSPTSIAWSVVDLGFYVCLTGDLQRASALAADGLERFEALGSTFGIYQARLLLAELRRGQHRPIESLEHYRVALDLQRSAPIRTAGADVLFGLGGLALDAHQSSLAARLFGAGETWRSTFGRPGLMVARHDADTARARRTLSYAEWVRDHGSGCALGVDGAQQLAVSAVDQLRTFQPAPAGLTGRELEVLRLVVLGLSDGDIAGELRISRRTVHSHVRSIFAKLDVTSRTAAAHRATTLSLA